MRYGAILTAVIAIRARFPPQRGSAESITEPGTVDFSNVWSGEDPIGQQGEDEGERSVPPIMGLDRKLHIDDETNQFVYGKLQRSRTTKRKELRTIWEPYKKPELKLVRTTLSETVDNDAPDSRRDASWVEQRVCSRQVLRLLMNALGPEIFMTLRHGCWQCEGMEEIGELLGFKGAQRGGAAAALLRTALLRAADIYAAMRISEGRLESVLGEWRTGIVAGQSSVPERRAA